MSFFKHSLVAAVVVIGTSAWVGCGAAQDDSDSGGQDVTASGACKVIAPHQGNKELSADDLTKLNDPIAKRVLAGGCPQKLDGILTSVNAAKDCKTPKITTRVVSDRALLLDAPDSYRGVLTEDCAGGSNHDMFISIFGINPGAAALPQDGIEVIGHDTTNGVFNFYVNEGGWKFMGSSKDAIADGYDCGKNGDCLPKSASKARCWACHESGGINMKELNSPWHSWSNTPIHSDTVFKKFGKSLGTEEDGINQEQRTEGGNSDWAKTRVKLLKDQGVSEVLRPLFCTLTINLQASGSSSVSSIPTDFFVDSTSAPLEVSFDEQSFPVSADLTIDPTAYASQIAASGQKVVDSNGKQLSAHGKGVTGSPSGFIFPKKGDVDRRYIAQLVADKVIDKDFVQDVLHTDFTRPIFSPDRCALVDKAPKLSAGDMTPDKIREGFKKNLAGASGAGAQLLKNLSDTNDSAAHAKDLNDFMAKCNARPKADVIKDVLQYNAHLRTATKAHRTKTPDGVNGIIEFSETFPTDNLGDTSKAFDPTTCELK